MAFKQKNHGVEQSLKSRFSLYGKINLRDFTVPVVLTKVWLKLEALKIAFLFALSRVVQT